MQKILNFEAILAQNLGKTWQESDTEFRTEKTV
jgi:hypothetical protein